MQSTLIYVSNYFIYVYINILNDQYSIFKYYLLANDKWEEHESGYLMKMMFELWYLQPNILNK